jgi:hypothetical protein
MKKVGVFFLLCFAFMGIVGGIGYTIDAKAYPIAAGVAVAGWMALPKFKELSIRLWKE